MAAPPEQPSGGSPGRRWRLGPPLLVVLLALALTGFVVTRALRVEDDIVNSVRLSDRIAPGQVAEVSFRTTEGDARADVLITDTEDRQVRALQLGERLAAGEHSFRWDGTGDDGTPVPAGEYGLRVILAEQGRDIKPPGRITVVGGGSG